MNLGQSASGKRSGLWDIIRPIRKGLTGIALISGFLNLLLIGGALYMMVMFDTVVPGQSGATLVGLFLLSLFGIGAFAVFGILRARLLGELATALNVDIVKQLPAGIHYVSTFGGGIGDGLQPLDDLEDIRVFLSGPTPGALLDLPWVILAVIFLFVAHMWLGLLALVAVVVMAAPCYMMERSLSTQIDWLAEARAHRRLIADEHRRHTEAIEALGMVQRFGNRWVSINSQMLDAQQRQEQMAITLDIVSRAARMVILAAVVTVGIWLAFDNEASTGVIIACAILLYQIFAPVDRAVSGWGGFAAARNAWDRLNILLPLLDRPEVTTILPPPVQSLEVSQLAVGAPGRPTPLIQNVGFKLNAGEALGIVGGNGVGKTVLMRALAGYWRQGQGVIRLDGAVYDQWDREALGEHIGYLPQNVELLNGTVAQNIARFDPGSSSEEVIAAAKAAGVHEFILRLPEGYETDVGRDGRMLPPGYRQRVALARAMFRDPFILLLDDPDSSLDQEGHAMVLGAIDNVRARRGITIIVAYQLETLATVDHIMVMQKGTMAAFGPRDRMLNRLRGVEERPLQAPPTDGQPTAQ